MMNDSSLFISSGTPVVCAYLAINAKEPFENTRPGITLLRQPRSGRAQDRQLLAARFFHGSSQRFRRVRARPRSLLVKNNAVHVTAPNSDDRRTTDLTFQRDEAKSFLNSWMNEKIGRAIKAGEVT